MNLLQQERFARLQFPVHKMTAKTPVELFEILPGLRRYFQKLVPEGEYEIPSPTNPGEKIKVPGYEAKYRGIFPDDLVKIIKYIVLLYDPESDILNEYPDDLRLMKEAAAKEAGFKRLRDGVWTESVERIFDFKEKAVVDWIVDYLKVKKNPIWMQIKFIEEELETLYRQRTAALLRNEVRQELMKLIRERTDERDILYKRFYSEHSDLKKATQDELYPISPENIFRELKIPAEITNLRQTRDVPKNAGGEEAPD